MYTQYTYAWLILHICSVLFQQISNSFVIAVKNSTGKTLGKAQNLTKGNI